MKILALIFLAIPCFAQTELVEITRRWPNRIDINVTDGLIHRRVVSDQSDTVFYFHANGKQYIATTTFKQVGGVPPGETETTIDGVTTDSRNQYTGTWVHSTSSWTSVFGGTASYSNTPGATLTISFTGNRIQWFSEMSNNKGSAVIKIDDGPEIAMSLFGSSATPPNVKSMVFDSAATDVYKNLPQGPHKFIIRVVNPSVLHDEVKVFSK